MATTFFIILLNIIGNKYLQRFFYQTTKRSKKQYFKEFKYIFFYTNDAHIERITFNK